MLPSYRTFLVRTASTAPRRPPDGFEWASPSGSCWRGCCSPSPSADAACSGSSAVPSTSTTATTTGFEPAARSAACVAKAKHRFAREIISKLVPDGQTHNSSETINESTVGTYHRYRRTRRRITYTIRWWGLTLHPGTEWRIRHAAIVLPYLKNISSCPIRPTSVSFLVWKHRLLITHLLREHFWGLVIVRRWIFDGLSNIHHGNTHPSRRSRISVMLVYIR